MANTVSKTINNVSAAIETVIQPYLVDVVFEDFALLSLLEEMGKVVMPDPSYDISWPVVSGKLNSGSYGLSGIYKFPGTAEEIFDRAVLSWKNVYSDVAVPGPSALRASGPYASFQLVDGLKQAARMTIGDEMGSQIYAEGTNDDMDGARVGIDDGVLYPTYAGITRSGLAGWKSNTDATAAIVTLPLITAALGTATIGNDSPDLIMTTQVLWDALQDRAQTQQVFDRNDSRNNVARLGFRVISHLGANIVHDSKCPANHMFGINSEYMELCVMPDRIWSWTGWEKIPGSDGYQAQFLFMGNLKFMAPRMCFKRSNLS